jgi:AcrR family transcriptional regulator
VAAQHQFVAAGFEGASVRSIAAEAGVDPSLVNHYFGSTYRLLGAVMAWPIDSDEIAEQVVARASTASANAWCASSAQWDDPSKRHPDGHRATR